MGVPTFRGYVHGGCGDFKNRKKMFFVVSNITTYFETLKPKDFQKKLINAPPYYKYVGYVAICRF